MYGLEHSEAYLPALLEIERWANARNISTLDFQVIRTPDDRLVVIDTEFMILNAWLGQQRRAGAKDSASPLHCELRVRLRSVKDNPALDPDARLLVESLIQDGAYDDELVWLAYIDGDFGEYWGGNTPVREASPPIKRHSFTPARPGAALRASGARKLSNTY